jgi:hypothetical protein
MGFTKIRPIITFRIKPFSLISFSCRQADLPQPWIAGMSNGVTFYLFLHQKQGSFTLLFFQSIR